MKADLRRRFRGWNIIRTDYGRWWAMRQPTKDRDGKPLSYRTTALDADTPDALAGKLEKAAKEPAR